MATKVATSQITILDWNDITIASSAPGSPVLNQLWFDNSITPPALKQWNGSVWVSANISPADYAKLNGIANNANNTYIDGNGNIQGVSSGTGTNVANNQDAIIRNPIGGYYVGQVYSQQGAIKIRLPQLSVYTMIKLTVDIYEYLDGYSCLMEISGYIYGGLWTATTARVVGSSNVEYPVRFGNDGVKGCIWIGNSNESWSYPQVRIKEVFLGYANYDRATWESGWAITFDTSAPTNVTSTILDTLPGADWSKIARTPNRFADAPSGTGLFMNDSHMGYYSGGSWKTYFDNVGNLICGDVATGPGMVWDQNAALFKVRGDIEATSIKTNALSIVSTGNIQSNAVTKVVSAFTPNEVYTIFDDQAYQQVPTLVQSASITSSGEKIEVIASIANIYGTSSIKLYRDTTLLYEVLSFGLHSYTTVIMDTPPAGTYNYNIKALGYDNYSNMDYCKGISLILKELKR